jgi:hypothetical protein|nr:MAG TPA: hypothetical protein [Caudoviricetes sp.]
MVRYMTAFYIVNQSITSVIEKVISDYRSVLSFRSPFPIFVIKKNHVFYLQSQANTGKQTGSKPEILGQGRQYNHS